MKKDIIRQIEELQYELQQNDYEIPDHWKRWIPLIKFALSLAKIFTPNYIDGIIDEILAAIAEYEQAVNKG